MTDDAPQASIYFDNDDLEAERLYKEFQKNPDSLALLFESAKKYRTSSNPDGTAIADLLESLYYHRLARITKDKTQAIELLDKAFELLEGLVEKDKPVKQVQVSILKKKIELFDSSDFASMARLFEKKASILRELKDTVNYHIDMAMMNLFRLREAVKEHDEEAVIGFADSMVRHARLSKDEELYYKAKSIFHGTRAQTIPDITESVKEFNKAIKANEKTSDNFGIEELKANMLFTKALATVDPTKRKKLIDEGIAIYEQKGQKDKVSFGKSLIANKPLAIKKIVSMLDLAIEKHGELDKKILAAKKPQPGPHAIFYHHSYLIERIRDIGRIVERISDGKSQMREITIELNSLDARATVNQKPSDRAKELWKRENELRQSMRMDMESLYVFGALALDQWAYTLGYLAGISEEDEDFTFARLVNRLESNNYQGPLVEFWSEHKRDIIWLFYQFRGYRNTFIEHARRPWQKGDTMSVYGEDYNLHIPTPPGWLEDKEVRELLESVKHLIPERLKRMPDDYWEKANLHRSLEVTYRYIDELDRKVDRDKVAEVWCKVGGSTPSYTVIANRLSRFLLFSVMTAEQIFDDNPDLVKLGEPKHLKDDTSEEGN